MTVEERFGITIADEEAQQVATPRQLTDLVLGKIKIAGQRSCLSQKSFHLLRRKAMDKFAVPRARFRPDTRLNEIIPMARRRVLWAEWQASLAATMWPELCRSSLLFGLLTAMTLTASAYAWLVLREATTSSFLAYAGAGLTLLGAGWLGAVVTRPWRLEFQAAYSNVGELSQFLVARNPELLQMPENGWTHERVWCVIRDLIIEITGASDFNQDSDFSKDIFG